ncbi:unnamed protein product [Parascedosporium putredinis]|uniref:Uncharacterized protein n=1 Tax=Parascedosporium putredinis TaxID=1442378 RepID=A0A9P1MDR0_9PEZI|nr:unnamed protein product [Parascedosporium putredinis]CAI8004153.1 unnamed protein product [Parascedosporium putredinis]
MRLTNVGRAAFKSSASLQRSLSALTTDGPRVSNSRPRHQAAGFHSTSYALSTRISPTAILDPAAVLDAGSSVDIYKPPTTGLLAYLPKSWVPYAELVRLDKPAGTHYLFFPCLFSTLMAAPMAAPMASPPRINDLWDRNLDPHVTRTKFRPIARGAITPFKGLVYTGFQLLAGLGILLQFPTSSIMGFPALGVDLLSNSSALTAAGCLYASNIAWTVLYDMIYAHMDRKDDVKAGIKSMAVKHDAETKRVLSGLAVVQVGLLAAAGVASGAGPLYFIGTCGGAMVSLGYMIRKVNLKNVKDCWWWFVNGCWITGGTISLGLGADYLVRYVKRDEEEEPVPILA